MILVDTSVWIEVFRSRRPLDLANQIDPGEIVTCLPIIQEVLQGFGDERAYRLAREAMFNFPVVESPLDASVYLEAVDLFRTARRAGVTVRSSMDCLIAACAVRHDLVLVHRDRDFRELARVSRLRQREL